MLQICAKTGGCKGCPQDELMNGGGLLGPGIEVVAKRNQKDLCITEMILMLEDIGMIGIIQKCVSGG